jgi:hypothetical protein
MRVLSQISKLFQFIGLPDLTEYEIDPRPTRRQPKVQKQEPEKVDEFGFKGHWKDSQHYEAVNINQKQTKREGLDAYDETYLNELVKGWAKSEQTRHRARQIKELWVNGNSAKSISKITGIGLSERSLDPYVKAFRLADERREQEGQKRVRLE